MITASTYTYLVMPLVVIALGVGALFWSNANAQRFDEARAHRVASAGVAREAELRPDANASIEAAPAAPSPILRGSVGRGADPFQFEAMGHVSSGQQVYEGAATWSGRGPAETDPHIKSATKAKTAESAKSQA